MFEFYTYEFVTYNSRHESNKERTDKFKINVKITEEV